MCSDAGSIALRRQYSATESAWTESRHWRTACSTSSSDLRFKYVLNWPANEETNPSSPLAAERTASGKPRLLTAATRSGGEQ